MELANIEKLLKKYLDAETTIAEEKELKTYFSSDNVAPHLQEYQEMFGYFSTNKNERFTKTIQLKSQKMNWKWLSVAASVVLLVSVYTGYQNNQQKKAEKILTIDIFLRSIEKARDIFITHKFEFPEYERFFIQKIAQL